MRWNFHFLQAFVCSRIRFFKGLNPVVWSRYNRKKPRGQELSDQDKEENRIKSQERVVIEHSIGSMKVWRCVREICRSPRYERRDSLTFYATGLHNFRLRLRKNNNIVLYETKSE
jgi:DNA polymerase III delta prime subunit